MSSGVNNNTVLTVYDGVITKYSGRNAELKIGSGVCEVDGAVFSGSEELESVSFSEGLRVIGKRCFENCTNLTAVTLPASLEKLGEYAFADCHSLKDIKIPAAMHKIDAYVFKNCYSMKSVRIPENITELEVGAFLNCKNLDSVHIPETVTDFTDIFGQHPFTGCPKLRIYTPSGSPAEEFAKEHDIPFVNVKTYSPPVNNRHNENYGVSPEIKPVPTTTVQSGSTITIVDPGSPGMKRMSAAAGNSSAGQSYASALQDQIAGKARAYDAGPQNAAAAEQRDSVCNQTGSTILTAASAAPLPSSGTVYAGAQAAPSDNPSNSSEKADETRQPVRYGAQPGRDAASASNTADAGTKAALPSGGSGPAVNAQAARPSGGSGDADAKIPKDSGSLHYADTNTQAPVDVFADQTDEDIFAGLQSIEEFADKTSGEGLAGKASGGNIAGSTCDDKIADRTTADWIEGGDFGHAETSYSSSDVFPAGSAKDENIESSIYPGSPELEYLDYGVPYSPEEKYISNPDTAGAETTDTYIASASPSHELYISSDELQSAVLESSSSQRSEFHVPRADSRKARRGADSKKSEKRADSRKKKNKGADPGQKKKKHPVRTVLIILLVILLLALAGAGAYWYMTQVRGASAGVSSSDESDDQKPAVSLDYTATLEDFVKYNDDAQAQIDQSVEGTNVDVSIKGNTLIYTYDLSGTDGITQETAESDEVKEALESTLDSGDDNFVDLCSGLEEDTGISGITVEVSYVFGDTTLVTREYTSEGRK